MHPATHRLRRPVASGLLVLLVTAFAAAPVLAAPRPSDVARPTAPAVEEARRGVCADAWAAARAEPSVANLQAVGRCEIDRRFVTIERLRGAVDGARRLTDDHEAALERILDRSASGLRELRAEIDAATTVGELRLDLRRIVEDFRIYLLVVPQVRLVIAADVTDAAIARAIQVADRLEQAIEAAEEAGTDVGDAKEHLASMRAHIRSADAKVDGLAAKILPLTPADWNDGTAGPILERSRLAIAEARRVELRAAIADARAIIAELR